MNIKIQLMRAARIAFCLSFSLPAYAAEDNIAHAYPSRTITIVTTAQVGGTTDIMARIIAEKLSASWEHPVIVDSKTGANGMIGTSAVAKSKGDGYTVLLGLSSVVQNVLLQSNPSYKLSDLKPVTKIAVHPFGYIVSSSAKANTLDSFIGTVKFNPQNYSYASWGIGSAGHLIGTELNRVAGLDLLHVPYHGEVAEFLGVMSGDVSSAFVSPGGLARNKSSTSFRMLAITGERRLRSLPDIPTFAEVGFPTLSAMSGWSGFFVPASTPQPIVDKLSKELSRIIHISEINQRIAGFGYEPVGGTSDEFSDFVERDLDRWKKIIQANSIEIR